MITQRLKYTHFKERNFMEITTNTHHSLNYENYTKIKTDKPMFRRLNKKWKIKIFISLKSMALKCISIK